MMLITLTVRKELLIAVASASAAQQQHSDGCYNGNVINLCSRSVRFESLPG
jgi:hypothetical protein